MPPAMPGNAPGNAPGGTVPAARRALAVLRVLAAAPSPLTAASLARTLGLPRSSVYHLLAALTDDGFVAHYPEERRWGLGVSAFELGSAYQRQDPLARQAGPVLAGLVRRLPSGLAAVAHAGVLHGRETLYVATATTSRRLTVVVETGVRLPATLTASGRALLASLPAAQLRALFPDAAAFVDRTGRGPRTPTALREALVAERRAGYAVERGFVTAGYASVAASTAAAARPLPSASSPALTSSPVPPSALGPVAGSIGLTVADADLDPATEALLADAVRRGARELARRLGAGAAPRR